MKRWAIPEGGAIAEGADGVFHHLDPEGCLIQDYAPRVASVENSLYTAIYLVLNDSLVEHMAVDTDAVSRTEARVEIAGLRELAPDEAPTPQDVSAAVSARDAQEDRTRKRLHSRITALARAPSAALPELAAIRRSLAARVVRYADDVCKDVLSCLSELAELHDELAQAPDAVVSVQAAADEFAGVARLITFSPDAADLALAFYPHSFGPVPSPPQGPLLEVLVGPRGQLAGGDYVELLDRLEELQQGLIFQADVQSQFDATATKAAYLRAATRVARAAPHVAVACLRAAGLSES